jgi:type I restriction enzyme S subunit
MDTKALRQKILDLAIHGKLVPQDPNDEPASVLLERIRAEKERLIKKGKIKKGKKSAKTSDKPHYPFELPKGWVWTTVGEISKSILYGVSESAKSKGEYKLLRITDIKNNAVDWNTVPYTDYDEHKANAYLISDGDILFARTGATVGKSYLVKGLQDKAIYASYLIRVQTFNEILPEYVKYFFESGFYWEQIQRDSIGIGQPNVNGTTLSQLALSIPPINEQHRIVNELGSWLNIIDVIDNGKAELQIAIKRVKSKILDLAIHGKLVPQDPNDEPASELLKRINSKAEITCDNPQYGKLPKGWCLCKISSVVDIVNGKSQKNVESPTGKYPIYGSGGIIGKAMEYTCLAGSTIIGRKGTINHPIFVEENFWNVDTAFGMKANNQILEDKYFYCFCLYFDFSKLDKSSALPSLTKTVIGNLILPIPPLAEQQRIVAKIEELFSQLDKIESSLQA